jgi:hypothetical protein
MAQLNFSYEDTSSNAYNYVVYTSKDTISKFGYTPFYFEYAKNLAKFGPVVVIVYNKNNLNCYSSYIYNNDTDEYWANRLLNYEKNYHYSNRHTALFNIN